MTKLLKHCFNSQGTFVVIASILFASAAPLTSCQTAYYNFWETFGTEKRDLLKDDVKKVNATQKDASAEIKDALTRFRELYKVDAGKLDSAYDKLKSDYESANSTAQKLKDRIEKMDQVAEDLFKEWEKEIKDFSNPDFKRRSTDKLSETRSRYKEMHRSMVRSEEKLQPILLRMRDNVTFLKHNLNAKALGSLQGEVAGVNSDIDALVKSLNESIKESDDFIKTLDGAS